MLNRRALCLSLTIFIGGLLSSELAAQEAVCKAGFAERDITPAIGSEQPGGYGKSYHRSLHDPCKVRAAVFDDGKQTVALVGIDALGIMRSTVLGARKRIEEKTKIPGSAVMIGASHSHSSGPLSGVTAQAYEGASDLVKRLALEESTAVDPKYVAHVEDMIVEAVTAAYESRINVKAAVGSGQEGTVAFNRRFRMRDGGSVSHPGQGNPAIREPAGPIDPEVGVIGAWNAEGKLIGVVVNFSCHATTNPGGISANYVYYLERVVQGYYGKDVPVVFLNGASGDVTQVNNQNPHVQPGAVQWAQLVGGKVGAEVLKVLFTIEQGAGVLVPVESRVEVLKIKRRVPRPERVTKAHELVQKDVKDVGATEWTFAKEIVMLDALLAHEPVADVEVQAVQVGPAVFLSTPAEYFCQYGLDQKAASGFPFTFPVSLANGCVGYVPTEEAFGPNGGGYETRLTSYSNLDITAGTQMRDAGVKLAKGLKPGAVPEPAKSLPFSGEPWSYGNVKPELD